MKDMVFDENAYLLYLQTLENNANNDDIEIISESKAIEFIILYTEKTYYYNSLELYKNLEYLNNNSEESNCFTELDENNKVKLIEKFIHMLESYYSNLNFYITTYNKPSNASNNSFINNALNYLTLLIELVYNWTNRFKKFSNLITEKNGCKTLFYYASSNEIIDTVLLESDNPELKQILNNIYKNVLGSIYNLSNQAIKYLSMWHELNSVEIFLKIVRLFSNKENLSHYYFVSYLTIANIFIEEDVNKLADLKQAIEEICKYVINISDQIKLKNIQRQFLKIYRDDEKIYEVAYVKDEVGNCWSLIDLIFALYRLSVIDSIKNHIYQTCKMNEHLRNLIYNGLIAEKDFSLKLLWQLSFDKNIRQDISKDDKLVSYLKDLKTSSESSKRIITKCNGILWLLNRTKQNKNESKPEIKTGTQQHIMISYNRQNRDLCSKIKNELAKQNLNVWIDIENMRGSSLDSMATAIENSLCVLICLTEKYKQSSNCRAEAEYAFQIKKPIIPLIMQKDYKPDGWLGIILGSKIYVDFTKYNFDECFKRLLKELTLINSTLIETELIDSKKMLESSKFNTTDNSNVKNNKLIISKWSETEALNWIKEKNFNELVVKNISPCDGSLLKQYYTMLNTVPEFFYSSLNVTGLVNLHDIAYFVNELKKLFE